MSRLRAVMCLTSLLLLALTGFAPRARSQSIRQIDPSPAPDATSVTAIVGATLVDGRGGPPLPDATVLIRGDRIALAGPSDGIRIPEGAERVDGRGLTLLPGLIDAHFHGARPDRLPTLFLHNGVTSLRDPGAWIESYAGARSSSGPVPRLFLTGPHLDSPPPAYPPNSLLVHDEAEVRAAVERLAASGASAIKTYFRLPLGLIAATTRVADSLGLPVTGHLEIVDAREAIRAGLDGIEHVTSFGTALMAPRAAEAYRQAVIADNEARREGRYRVWSEIDPDSPAVREVIDLLDRHDVFLSPTLAVYERRAGDENVTDEEVRGFLTMLRFTGLARRGGAAVVVGSHTRVPHATIGWGYHREMELLVEAGMTPMETIVAATSENARFLRIDDRLGTIEPGKLADLLLVHGDPAEDIRAMRQVRGVMLNGKWVRKTGWPGAAWERISPEEAGMDRPLLEEARDFALLGDGAGLVVRHGQVVMEWGDTQARYDLKSTTKSIGATALGLALHDRRIRIDDRLVELHPGLAALAEQNGQGGWLTRITLRQLATHTAGFEKDGGSDQLLFEPGTAWHYSDSGPNWLAESLTLLYRRDLREVMFDRVFTPLGIAREDLVWRENLYRPRKIDGIDRREFGAGIHANVNAMARIGYLYLRRGRWADQQILEPGFVDRVGRPDEAAAGSPVHDPSAFGRATEHYGLLWWNNADGALRNVPPDAYWAWGLRESFIIVVPSMDLVVVRAGKGWRKDPGGDHRAVLEPFLTPIIRSARHSTSSSPLSP